MIGGNIRNKVTALVNNVINVNNKIYRAHRHKVSNALECRLQYCANRNVFKFFN